MIGVWLRHWTRNVQRIGIADKVAIKENGIAHIELLLNSTVYVEQMALVTDGCQ